MLQQRNQTTIQYALRACLDSYQTCLETMHYCMSQGGALMESELIQVLSNCAKMCEANAQFLLTDFRLLEETSSTCSSVCEITGDYCAQYSNDLQLRRCAEVCRRCSDLCEKLTYRQAA